MEDSIKSTAAPHGPLHGLRVMDISTVYAAPFAATLLADYGADVIKVEKPGTGDPLRSHQPFEGSESLPWVAVSRNKKSVTLDLRSPKGKDVFLRLLKDQDVLLENFRPGTLDKWGLGIERLREINPKIVVIRVSGFGQTGPLREKAGFGHPATAFSGYAYMSGTEDGPPTLPPISLVDYMSGLFATIGALAALYNRDALGGKPQEVDVALYESILRIMDVIVTPYQRLGEIRERTQMRGGTASNGVFETRDGQWMVLASSTDEIFARLAKMMGRSDMLTDPEYSTNPARIRNRALVVGIIKQWFSEHEREEISQLADEHAVPIERVNSIADVFAEPQVQARDMLVEVEHPSLGTLVVPGVVPKFSETPGQVCTAGPSLGEHNDDVYQSFGISPEELQLLKEEGVI